MDKKQLIGSIGLIILVIGLGIGLYLVQTKQIFKSRAGTSAADSAVLDKLIRDNPSLSECTKVSDTEIECETDEEDVPLNLTGIKDLPVPNN
jgi:hypothetical protein